MSIYRFSLPYEITTQIHLINLVHNSDVMSVIRLIAEYNVDGLDLHN